MRFFENRKIRGAISIFLVIITIPTMLFSAVLVDGSRMASARAMTQEAADLAAASVLAEYNLDLKEDYGLFAMENSDGAEDIYRKSMEATLLASGFSGAEEYSEQLWNILKDSVGAGSDFDGKNFLNLYDFSVDSCTVTPKYSLGEWQVLENQMVEYAKFRGLFVMADRFNILKDLGAAKEQAEQNQVTAGVMEDKMDVDEKNMAADQALAKLRTALEQMNQAVTDTALCYEKYEKALEAKMKELRLEYTETDETMTAEELQDALLYEGCQNDLKRSADGLDFLAGQVLDYAEDARKETENAIGRLEDFQSDNSGKASGNSNVSDLVGEAKGNVDQYKTLYLPKINSILEDSVLNQLRNDRELPDRLEQTMTQIDGAIHRCGEELEELEEQGQEEAQEPEEEGEDEEEEETVYYYYYLNSQEKTEDADSVLNGSTVSKCYKVTLQKEMAYFLGKQWEVINPTRDAAGGSGSSLIDEDAAKAQSGKKQETAEESSEGRREIPEEIYSIRPSKTFESEGSAEAGIDFYNESGDLSASKGLIHKGTENSLIQQVGEVLRDDVLCLSYMFGTFKTRLTGVERLTGSGMSESDKNSFYMPDWRKNHENGELDMRFEPKKDKNTVLRGEIEYLICGNRTDAANENTVYALIYAERMANNMIAVYGSSNIKRACHSAAAVASAATGFVVPETVFFWIFLTAWGAAETFADMNYLMQGYRIPLWKDSKNLLLDSLLDMSYGIERYGQKGIFVSYEDYLMVMLLIAGENTRLMRAADLIEMNMRQKQPDFTMAGAYTFINAKTELSTRYLFGSVGPFQETYAKENAVGRMRFTNEIYLGY